MLHYHLTVSDEDDRIILLWHGDSENFVAINYPFKVFATCENPLEILADEEDRSVTIEEVKRGPT
jgi:hypothetical protein